MKNNNNNNNATIFYVLGFNKYYLRESYNK